jgi:hypothetical protein
MNSSSADEDFSPLKEQLAQMKREGRHDEVLRLQADIKKQIDDQYRSQLSATPKVSGKTKSSSSHHHASMERRDRRRHLELDGLDELPHHVRDHAERRRRFEDGPRRSLGPPMTDEQKATLMKGLSDERSIYHMEQSHRKSGILHHKLSLGEGTFRQEELTNYYDLIEQYLQLEKIVATFLQKTSEDYEKARSIADRDERKQYLESVKAAWDLRKPQEKAARDAARDAFLQIKHMMEGHIEAHSARGDL